MNRLFVGIFIGGVILFIIYYYNNKEKHKKSKDKSLEVKKEPLAKDIVLAKINNGNMEQDFQVPEQELYAILWNSIPGTIYNYSIEHIKEGSILSEEKEIKDNITASSNLIKIKGMPLVEKEKYKITVNDTIITTLLFDPPSVVKDEIYHDGCRVRYNDTPTDIEIIVDNKKIPLEYINIYPESSSIEANFGEYSSDTPVEVIIMVYKGPNVVNILTSMTRDR